MNDSLTGARSEAAASAGPTDYYLRLVPELPGAARNRWPASRAYPEAVPRCAEKGEGSKETFSQ